MKQQRFHDGWQFARAGEEKRPVRIPHDAMLEEKRSPDAAGQSACAFFPGAVYEYEKTFTAPKDWEGQEVILQFEGVYQKSKVYLNGTEVGRCVYGYLPFFVSLTDKIKIGQENLVKVVADNSCQPNSRWYSGGGIYRGIKLWTGAKGAIAPEGVQVTTLSVNPARICVKTRILEEAGPDTDWETQVQIYDGDQMVASASGSIAEMDIPDAKLWSEDTPHLYRAHVILKREQTTLDTADTLFGIRQITYSNKGLFINGKETLLRGGCIHHDNGILGAVSLEESEWRKVKILKDAGFNAIRSSHYPASPALLDACDALGVYVMDETWDMWYKHKNPYDYAGEFMDHYRDDIEAMVSRDYNHPSVIMYSIGNEVSEPATEKGVNLAKEMVALFHSLDDTRIVTGGMNLMIISRSAGGNDIFDEEKGRDTSNEKKMSGMNSTMFNMITSMVGTGMNKGANNAKADQITSPVLDALDVAGYNYASGRYPLEAKAHPDRVVFGSETFPQDIAKNWKMVKEYPYLIGDFMWTAWDYMGEAGIGAWAYTEDGKGFEKTYPWLLADVGALDLLGDPNGEMLHAQAVWEQRAMPLIGVQPVNHPGVQPAKGTWRGTNSLPSWSWQGCEGNKAVVEVYGNGSVAALFLNGKRIGKKKLKNCKAVFKMKYQPGELKAVMYDASGAQCGSGVLRSAEGDVKLSVKPEECAVIPGFYEGLMEGSADETVSYVDITLTGDNGILESNADRTLHVTVENGTLLGFGSANPRTEQTYQSGTFDTYYGKAVAVVLTKKGEQAKVKVKADVLLAECTL